MNKNGLGDFGLPVEMFLKEMEKGHGLSLDYISDVRIKFYAKWKKFIAVHPAFAG